MIGFDDGVARSTMHTVIEEALEIVGREGTEDIAERVREHVLDRWYRFEAFGVRSRAELSAVRVTLEDAPSGHDRGEDRPSRWTTVSVIGTPLEGQI